MTTPGVSRQIIRPGQQDDVPAHEHEASEISGTFNFVRILKAILDGDIELNAYLRTALTGNRIEIRPATEDPSGISSLQFFDDDGNAAFIEIRDGEIVAGSFSLLLISPDNNTAIHLGDNLMTFAANAAIVARIAPGQMRFADGTAAAPVLARVETEDGVFFASGVVGVAISGTEVARFVAGALRLVNGDATTPALAPTADADTGVFFDAAVVGVSVAGSEVARFTATAGHNLQGLAWTTWTPTYTQLTVGNGTVTARYVRIGDTVHARWNLTLGSTSAIGTNPTLTLPIAAHASYLDFEPLDSIAQLRDADGSNFLGHIRLNSTSRTEVSIRHDSSAGTTVASAAATATSPFTWTTGDLIAFSTTYEAA